MSMRSLTTIAAQRNHGPPLKAEPEPADHDEAKKTVQGQFLDVLVAAIPTEPLALYTFLVGVVVGTIDLGESQRLGLRWAIYVGGLAVVAAWLLSGWLGQRRESPPAGFPAAELATASLAFAAWGLVMPQSPLSSELSGDNRVIWTAIITVVGVALLGLLSRSLQKPRDDTASAKSVLTEISSVASRIRGKDDGAGSEADKGAKPSGGHPEHRP